MKKTSLLIRLILVYVFLFSTPAYARQTLTFGVYPFKKPTELKKMFTPLISYLSDQLDADIQFRSAPNYTAMLDAIANDKIDIFFIGPAPFVTFDNKYPGKIRLAAVFLNRGKPKFNGAIVAKEGNGIDTLADLKGKSFAFGDRRSTASCLLPANHLIQAGIFKDVRYQFAGSHDNVALGVLNETFAGGGMKFSVAQQYLDKGLKIIAETETVFEHGIGVSSTVSNRTYKNIQTALFKASDPTIFLSINSDFTGFAPFMAENSNFLKTIIKTVDHVLPQ